MRQAAVGALNLSAEVATLIRDADAGDGPAIAGIYNHYITNTTATFEEAPVTGDQMQTRMQDVLASGKPWLVAALDGRVCGYAYASPWNTRSAYRYTVEVTLYIAAEMAGRGIGAGLYDTLFERLRSEGYRTVIAVITLPNPASIRIHEKFGLQPAGLLPRVGQKFGEWYDVGIWCGAL